MWRVVNPRVETKRFPWSRLSFTFPARPETFDFNNKTRWNPWVNPEKKGGFARFSLRLWQRQIKNLRALGPWPNGPQETRKKWHRHLANYLTFSPIYILLLLRLLFFLLLLTCLPDWICRCQMFKMARDDTKQIVYRFSPSRKSKFPISLLFFLR